MDVLTAIASQAKDSPYLNQCRLVLASEDPYTRLSEAGHITASGLVIENDKVLLILHPYIQRWFQPGGHIDSGESPIDAAIREVYEETGYVCEIDPNNQDPIDIDIHEIPENLKKGEGAHVHIDLLYQLKVLRQEQSIEEIKFQWFSIDDIKSIRIQRALAKLV
jgi:8-oxo-dGTP pyrophosphatase MutT (NUDIX family)